MLRYYIFGFLGFVLFSEILLLISKAKPKVTLLYLVVSIGIVFLCVPAIRAEFDRADCQRRTNTIIGTVIDLDTQHREESNCVEKFKLQVISEDSDGELYEHNLPYTFQTPCRFHSKVPLDPYDVVQIRFIAPIFEKTNPEVLDIVLNLTWEVDTRSQDLVEPEMPPFD